MRIVVDDLNNTRRVLRSVKDGLEHFQTGIRRGLLRVGRENVRHARKLVRDKNKNGRIYSFKGKPHQASAPGEAPANMSGTLQKTMKYIVRGHQQMEFGDQALYGKFLEDGTVKMAARPHLSRTINEKARDTMESLGNGPLLRIKRATT